MPVHLYFVRHGQTTVNYFGRLSGASTNHPLTRKGRIQAMRLHETIATLHPDAIYCSPLLRAVQTAEIAISGLPDMPEIIFDDRLKERDFGKIDGSFSLLKLKKVWDYNKSYTRSNYGEETLLSLELRIEGFLNMLTTEHQDQTVIVFSHGGIGTTIHAILDEDHERFGFFFKHFHMKNGELTYFLLE